MESFTDMQAKSDFQKAKNKAVFREILKKVLQINNELFQFDEVKYLLAPHGMVYRGIMPIPLNKIIGSEGRYNDFDKDFLPKSEHTKDRWISIDKANIENKELPPISVYKIGDFYFVRDGNHRVSVAREKGQEFIDAEVVELLTRVPLDKNRLDEKALLLAESKRYFFEKTGVDLIIPDSNIEITNPWGYYRLVEHISNYAYFLGEREKRNIPWEEVVKRWYNELYLKVVNIIRQNNLLERFPNRTEADLYVWIMDHWHFLKEKYGEMPLENAANDYASKFGISGLALVWYKIKKFFRNLLTGRDKDA